MQLKQILTSDYYVSNQGHIFSKKSGRFLKYDLNSTGYRRVTLYLKNGKKRVFVHHLVAHYFIAPRKDNLEVDHINRNRTDNRVENLQYLSKKDNLEKRVFNEKI